LPEDQKVNVRLVNDRRTGYEVALCAAARHSSEEVGVEMRTNLRRLLTLDAALVVVFFLIAFATRNHQDGDYGWIASIGWFGFLLTLLALIILAAIWLVLRVTKRRQPA
jgi:hypothetical protein